MHPLISSPLQTATSAVIALALAQALHLPPAIWAPISAIVCSLDAFKDAYKIARRRLIGTFIGVVIAAVQISLVPHNLLSYGIAIAILGLICRSINLHPSSLRFGAIALTVVAIEPERSGVWLTATIRFADVALGIVVALLVIQCWPRPNQKA